jgi:hypothetical protein
VGLARGLAHEIRAFAFATRAPLRNESRTEEKQTKTLAAFPNGSGAALSPRPSAAWALDTWALDRFAA